METQGPWRQPATCSGGRSDPTQGGTRMHGELDTTTTATTNLGVFLLYLLAFKGVPFCWLS